MTTFAAPHKGKIVVQSFFGPRIVDGSPGFHPGIDVTSDYPTGPLYSMHAGTVVARWSYKSHAQNILVVSDDGTGILYSGLSDKKVVPIGSSVAAGDEIGVAGNTDAGRYHTHIEVVTPQGVARMGLTRGQDAVGKSVWLFNGKSLSDSTNAGVGKGYYDATRTGLPNNINGDAYRQDVLIPGDLVVPWTQVSPNASAQLPQIFKWSPQTWHAANQLHPYLAETLQAGQLVSGANSFNPPGLSPADINRFYSDIHPGTDPLASLGNGVPSATPLVHPDANAAQLFAKVPASDFPAFPSWASPSGTISPTNPPPANSSPALSAPQKQKRSAAPDDPAWTSAQGAPPARAAFQPNSAYPPAGGLVGNFPRASVLASAQSPAAFNQSGSSSGPWTAADFNALAQGIRRLLDGAPQLIGNGLIAPAEAASLSGPLWPSPTAPNFLRATPMASQSNPAYFAGSNGSLATDANGPEPPIASENLRRLGRRTYSQSPPSVFDTGAPAVPFLPSDDPNFSGGLPGRLAAVLADMDQTQAAAPPLDEGTQAISGAKIGSGEWQQFAGTRDCRELAAA